METSRFPVNCTRGYKMEQELATTNATYSLTSNVVRKLTGAATQDELAEADYFEIYRRLRGDKSLTKFADDMKIAYPDAPSKAELGRWENGEVEARRRLRNAMRVMDGLPLLPPTINEVMDKHCDPDAPVFFLGDDNGKKAEAVLLVASVSAARITEVSTTTNGDTSAVPAGTRARRPCYRPRLRDDQGEAIAALGMSAEELVDWALEMKRREL
jgi:hypothetical protein